MTDHASPTTPRATVVIPTYSRQDMVLEAVDSVLAQGCDDIEVLVVDDGSPIPIEVPDAPGVRVVRRVNGGLAAARNTGISNASGEVVFFLDSDDWFLPGRIEEALVLHDAGADIVVCGQRWEDGSGAITNEIQRPIADHALDSMTPQFGAISVVRSRCPMFDERYRASQDVEWWVRASQTNTVEFTRVVSLAVRRHDGERHLNGTSNRVESAFALLDDHAEFFDGHPRAKAFRLARVSRMATETGDVDLGVRAGLSSVTTRPTRTGTGALARAARAKLDALAAKEPADVGLPAGAIASARVRTWRGHRSGPTEARLSPTTRGRRLLHEVAALARMTPTGRPSGQPDGAAHPPEVEVRTAFGTLIAARHDPDLRGRYVGEPFATAILTRLIRPGWHVADLGSGNGWYALLAARIVGTEGSLSYWEPDLVDRGRVARTLARNRCESRQLVGTTMRGGGSARLSDLVEPNRRYDLIRVDAQRDISGLGDRATLLDVGSPMVVLTNVRTPAARDRAAAAVAGLAEDYTALHVRPATGDIVPVDDVDAVGEGELVVLAVHAAVPAITALVF